MKPNLQSRRLLNTDVDMEDLFASEYAGVGIAVLQDNGEVTRSRAARSSPGKSASLRDTFSCFSGPRGPRAISLKPTYPRPISLPGDIGESIAMSHSQQTNVVAGWKPHLYSNGAPAGPATRCASVLPASVPALVSSRFCVPRSGGHTAEFRQVDTSRVIWISTPPPSLSSFSFAHSSLASHCVCPLLAELSIFPPAPSRTSSPRYKGN